VIIPTFIGQAALTIAAGMLSGSEVGWRGPFFDVFNRFVQKFIVLAATLFPFLIYVEADFPLPISVVMSMTALAWVATMRLRQELRKIRGILE
jgi:hypothetical protein